MNITFDLKKQIKQHTLQQTDFKKNHLIQLL
jgi:hypothetical protein